MPNGNQFQIVVIGDSIPWGQGLTEPQKFSELVRQAIEAERRQPAVLVHRFAHSGAVIGEGDAWPPNAPPNFDPGTFAGEMPSPVPTIWAQLNHAVPPGTADPHVSLVLVDGGINDVGVATIINPFTDDAILRREAQNACRDRMAALLLELARDRFPQASVVVTGYYPIFSVQSSVLLAIAWLQGLAIPIPFDLLIGQVLMLRLAQLSELWADAATLALRDAVNRVNGQLPARRVAYAHVPFGPENCLFAPLTWLFGLTPALTPQDPVAPERTRLCAADPNQARNPICYWASVGHPNAAGAWRYSRAVLSALRELGVLQPLDVLGRICVWAENLGFQCVQRRDNQRTACAAAEAAQIAQCNAANAQRMNGCNGIQCNAFANCGQIQCNQFTNCGNPALPWNWPCWAARGVCVAAAAVAQAACWVARGACIAAAATARALCVAGSLLILAACQAAARTAAAACAIWAETLYRSCQGFVWVVTRISCW